MEPLDWVDDEIARLERDDLLRDLPLPLRTQGATVSQDGRELINFASNDYLGLASDNRIIEAAIQATREQGLGRGASPLICGRSEIHQQLEQTPRRILPNRGGSFIPHQLCRQRWRDPRLGRRGRCHLWRCQKPC